MGERRRQEAAPGAASRSAPGSYARRQPEKTTLHKVLRENLETFLAQVRAGDPAGHGLPRHVEDEFRDYLKCGRLSEGFTLLKCSRCGEETVVPFSCKTKTFCPSCLTRRMHATAADLVGRVLPEAPYRHWVLALPIELRFHVARDESLLCALRAIFVRSVRSWLRRKARALGVPDALTGAVVFTQRFSSRLLLYPHFHAVFPDGVFALDAAGKLVFHSLRPTDDDVAMIVARIARKASKLLSRLSLDSVVPDTLDLVRAHAVQGELAIKIPPADLTRGRLLASAGGFSLQAARHLHEKDRAGLEFLVRYNLRPPLALSRLSELPSGRVLLMFKRPLADGTAALELEPLALLRRLASLVPPPGSHDTAYFGVFAAHSADRRRFVRAKRVDPEECRGHAGLDDHEEALSTIPAGVDPNLEAAAEVPPERYIRWADLLRKVYAFDVLACPCGGRRKVVDLVTQPAEIRDTLDRLGLKSERLEPSKARPPPQEEMFDPRRLCDGVDPPAPDYATT